MSEHYSKYELYRWSILVRERDEMTCFYCKRQALKHREIKAGMDRLNEKWRAGEFRGLGDLEAAEDELYGLAGEAHHIRAKYHYPELALDLDNGVTLCWRCHRQVIHSTYETFRIHVYPFRMYALRGEAARFNQDNQRRVSRRFR